MDNTAAAKAFVIARLRKWLDLFPGLRMRYYFSWRSDVHFVALDPTSFPMDDDSFLDAQLMLINDLRKSFEEHGLAISYKPEYEYVLREGTIEIQKEAQNQTIAVEQSDIALFNPVILNNYHFLSISRFTIDDSTFNLAKDNIVSMGQVFIDCIETPPYFGFNIISSNSIIQAA